MKQIARIVLDDLKAQKQIDFKVAEDRVHQRAFELIQTEFQPSTWKVFSDCVINGRSPNDVAAELNITVNAIHATKSRVFRRLRRDLAGLLD